MVFSSVVFLFLFLPLALLGHYLIAPRFRNYWLLLVSLVFYAWGGRGAVILLLVSIAANYLGGLIIEWADAKHRRLKPVFLFLTLAINLALLFYFKYFNFSISSLNHFLAPSCRCATSRCP